MLYKAKVAVCSDIRTKHSKQSEHHVKFLNVKPGVTARLCKVNLSKTKRNLLYIRNQSLPRSKHFPKTVIKRQSVNAVQSKSRCLF